MCGAAARPESSATPPLGRVCVGVTGGVALAAPALVLAIGPFTDALAAPVTAAAAVAITAVDVADDAFALGCVVAPHARNARRRRAARSTC